MVQPKFVSPGLKVLPINRSLLYVQYLYISIFIIFFPFKNMDENSLLFDKCLNESENDKKVRDCVVERELVKSSLQRTVFLPF